MELLTPFANTGEKEIFDEDTSPSGDISLEKGFTQLFELKPEEGGLFILRKKFNQLMYLMSKANVEFNTQSFPNWIGDADGLGTPYSYNKYAIVRYTDDKNYISIIDGNTGEPTIDSGWVIFDFTLKADKDSTASFLNSNITVTVGAGGDYLTINEALEYLSTLYPLYKNTGVEATINLLSGFIMQEQVLVRGLDLGWVTITGADTETVINHAYLTIDFTGSDYAFSSYPSFGVSKGGTLPRIGQLFKFNVASVGGEKHGISAIGAGSSADILTGCGVIDAGTYGIYAYQGSTINAASADASGAGTIGIYAYHDSTINAASADASGAGTYGIYAYHDSRINADKVDASGAGTYGIFASRGSTINADFADASGAGTYGILAYSGSTINAESADASGAGTHGIAISRGSTINANFATGTLNQTANIITAGGIIFK